MDMKKTAREIGLFEMAVNLSRVSESVEVARKVGASLPLPDKGIDERVGEAAGWLCGFGKSKYMFLTPEIALIEKMAEFANDGMEAIIAVPCDMEDDAKERLMNNLPQGMNVSVMEEPYFPEAFYPANAMIVICGYSGGERAMVLPETYRMAGHYSGFLGKKVFIPYVELESAVRYEGWMEVNRHNLYKYGGKVNEADKNSK